MRQALNFVDEGSGDVTLVFLHYFGGSSRTWAAVVDLLKDSFRCVAVDLPGFGDSAPLPSPATVEVMADEVKALLQKLRLNSYVLLGHSMGGKVAMQVAASNTSSTLQKLILVAPSPPTPEPMTDKQRNDLLKAYDDKEALRKSAEGLVAEPLSAAALNAVVDDNLRIAQTAWNDWLNTGSKEDVSAAVKNFQAPVLVISGEKDPNFSTAFLQKKIRTYLPQAKFAEIKNTGHLLPIEAPKALAQTIKEAVS